MGLICSYCLLVSFQREQREHYIDWLSAICCCSLPSHSVERTLYAFLYSSNSFHSFFSTTTTTTQLSWNYNDEFVWIFACISWRQQNVWKILLFQFQIQLDNRYLTMGHCCLQSKIYYPVRRLPCCSVYCDSHDNSAHLTSVLGVLETMARFYEYLKKTLLLHNLFEAMLVLSPRSS